MRARMRGIDKTKIKLGPPAIDAELEKVPNLIRKGGYIPRFDHMVPMDISWENYKYYRNKLNEIIKSTPVLGT